MGFTWNTIGGYEFLIRGTIFGQQFINRMPSRVTSVADATEDYYQVLTAFTGDIVSAFIDCSADNAFYSSVQVRDIGYVDGGTYVHTFSAAGNVTPAVTNGYMPPESCISFRLFTALGVASSGWKRIAGVCLADVLNGVLTPRSGGSLASGISNLSIVLDSQWTSPAGNVFKWCIDHSKAAGSLQYLNIESVGTPKLGTQNSRKFGHGG